MNTREIPRLEWAAYLDSFSRQHLDDPVTVEILSLELGAQLHVINRPLEGIATEVRGDASTITISAGSKNDDHVTHVIADAVVLRVASTFWGDDSVIEIEAADASTTLIYFDDRS